jgi:hypothetical protein
VRTKRSHEGYLLVDNSAGPGVDAGTLAELERRAGKRATVAGVSEGRTFEAGILTCAHKHCGQSQMIVNPLRTRDRAYCRKCDHYICDTCDLVRKLGDDSCSHGFIERKREQAAKAQQSGLILP